MKSKKIVAVLLLLLVLVLSGAYVLYPKLSANVSAEQIAPQEEASPEVQRIPAPDFTVYDLEGNAVNLSDFFGKPIVLNFWASWCGPCKYELPYFDEKYLELGEEVNFVMVNATGGRESLYSALNFIAESDYSLPMFLDTDRSAAYTYGVSSLPLTYFIDAEGNLITKAAGAIDAATLQFGIDLITD